MSAHHIVPMKTFMKVFWSLIALTALTVITAKGMNLAPFNGLVAFGIATVKGFLVMAFFMHLKYDSKMNRYIIMTSFFFVFLLYVFCVIDIATRVSHVNTL